MGVIQILGIMFFLSWLGCFIADSIVEYRESYFTKVSEKIVSSLIRGFFGAVIIEIFLGVILCFFFAAMGWVK